MSADPNSPMGRAHVVLQVKLAELDHLIGQRPQQSKAIGDAVLAMHDACSTWLVRLMDWADEVESQDRGGG